MIDVMSSSKSNEWATPIEFFKLLDDEFWFTLDPCATAENTKCKKYYTKEDDGLSKSWAGEFVFMNPPYGRKINRWMQKAYEETDAVTVCLVPARTDTRWWHKYAMKANEIRFLKGRLKFSEKNNAPFPSAVVIFEPMREKEPIIRAWDWQKDLKSIKRI